ncbi:helix-turn-helix domain-containing protein [Bacillus safensis]|uniref:helix-turn-helix domain-containing protein n=1 Tax=Bacillus safensis TaxID=561879 RepID=UPI002041EF09|nr:helix-turn-helix domain-containing protein [Bacillus safensis]MCM3139865.1 helix-turn-helix domain-containing protein [Bacillus safensis]
MFKKVIKKSVVDYIRERRMTQAAKDLIHTDQRAIDIALQYRFVSQESFTRALRRYMTCHPHVIGELMKKPYRNSGGFFWWRTACSKMVLSFYQNVIT